MILQTNKARAIGLCASLLLVIASLIASIVFGFVETPWNLALQAFRSFDGSVQHLIIRTIRLPRALIAGAVGGSLGMAGALMQAMSKNPLASPSIFGINAGAALAALSVYGIGALGRDGLSPLKLTLAGAAVTALFSSFTQGLLVTNEAALEQVLFWLAGSVQGRDLAILTSVFPFIAAAWLGSLAVAQQVNILALGDDVARGLGLRTRAVKAVLTLLVVMLAGSSVAVAGPIGFIGIVVPHIARYLVGVDHRWLLPYSGLLGGVLLLLADIGARFVIAPQEIPVGVMTAFIGAPFFILIARRGYEG